jgi:hypothetical protein
MKTLITLLFLTASVQAQEYYLCYTNTPPTNATHEAYWVEMGNRRGDDVRQWLKHDYPEPSQFPSVFCPADSRFEPWAGTVRATIDNLISNRIAESATLTAASSNYVALASKVTRGPHTLKDMRKAPKKTKVEDLEDKLNAVISRLEMQEEFNRQRGIMTPGAAMQEDK